MTTNKQAAVWIVGVGPGDPDLLSLRAVDALGQARVIVADADAVDIAQRFAPQADVVLAVDANGLPITRAAKAKKVAAVARKGEPVVRLMSGDPLFDGALAEEGAALHKAGMRFDVVPSPSVAAAAAAYAGIPLAGRKTTRVVVLADSRPESIPAADPATTLVFSSGADDAVEIAAALIAAEYAPETPIAIVRGGSTVEQRTLVSTLGDVAKDAKAAKLAGPGQVIVGETVGLRDELNWFETKPRNGCS